MCGIVGLASQVPIAQRDVLVTMRDAMSHRGPDDAGVWWSPDGGVGLTQRRLAIIDLSPGGHQPTTDASGQLWIIFNGEIYAETELSILATQCLDRRIPDKEPLTREVAAWEKQRNTTECRIAWQFTTQAACIKLKRLYPSIELG